MDGNKSIPEVPLLGLQKTEEPLLHRVELLYITTQRKPTSLSC